MPVFEVQDPRGRTLTLEGDSPPTEAELNDIFDQAYPEPTLKPSVPLPGQTTPTAAPMPFPEMVPNQAAQVQAAEATPEEQATTAKLQKPLLNLPLEAYAAPMITWLAPGSAPAFAKMAKSLIEGQTSPEGLAQLPYLALGGAEAKALQGAGMVGKTLGGLFGLQGAANMPAAVKEYYEAVKAGDKTRAAAAWGQLAMNSAMAMGGVEAVKGEPAQFNPPVIDRDAPPPGVVAEPSTLAKPTLLPESE